MQKEIKLEKVLVYNFSKQMLIAFHTSTQATECVKLVVLNLSWFVSPFQRFSTLVSPCPSIKITWLKPRVSNST